MVEEECPETEQEADCPPSSNVPSPGVTKKPPKHPNPRKTPKREALLSRESGGCGRNKSGKEEMGILSKILVTLLCSCKSPAATGELKRVIRQFREAAREATDEVGDDFKERPSKARHKRSLRHREEDVQQKCMSGALFYFSSRRKSQCHLRQVSDSGLN